MFFDGSLYRVLIYIQILKVMLFGPSSLSEKKSSGPKPNGVQWRLQEATPGMIALATIIVSTSPLFILGPPSNTNS